MTKRSTIKMNIRIILLGIAAMVTVVACKKEYDAPPVRTIPVGQILTVAGLRGLYDGVPVHFGGDSSVYAVVTADEQNGNLYKNIYVQDHTGAIILRLLNSGGLYQGDSIRIYLPGCVLSNYRGMLQLDSVDVDNNTVKQATGVVKLPQVVSIAQINQVYTPYWAHPLQGKLIKLEGVQFVDGEAGTATWADAVGQTTVNRTLQDCNGGTVIVRNSGFSNFAADTLPQGKGSFIGVLGSFDATSQLFVRDVNEAQMTGPRCGESSCIPEASLSEGFGSVVDGAELNIECWLNILIGGSGNWKGVVSGSEFFAEAKPPSFSPNEIWLISPPVQYTPGMALNFKTALGTVWQHDGLSVMITTNTNLNNGTDVTNATWTPITGATLASNGSTISTWILSGAIGLNSYLSDGDNFRIGFKYVGNGTSGANQATRFRIDDVTIQ